MIRMIRHLLHRGADKDAGCIQDVRDNDGKLLMAEGARPTHSAICNGRLDALRVLLRVGADPNAVDSADSSLLKLAISGADDARRVEMSRALLEANADAARKDRINRVPLHVAAAQGSTGVVDMLLARAPETLNHVDMNGSTPLMAAAEVRQSQAVRTYSALSPSCVKPMLEAVPSLVRFSTELSCFVSTLPW